MDSANAVGGPVEGPRSSAGLPDADALSERDRAVLDFERQWWRAAGAKETAIRDRFALSPTRYYQVLNALVDRPAALEADPLLVRRLRRLRAARGQRRSSQFLGNGGRAL